VGRGQSLEKTPESQLNLPQVRSPLWHDVRNGQKDTAIHLEVTKSGENARYREGIVKARLGRAFKNCAKKAENPRIVVDNQRKDPV